MFCITSSHWPPPCCILKCPHLEYQFDYNFTKKCNLKNKTKTKQNKQKTFPIIQHCFYFAVEKLVDKPVDHETHFLIGSEESTSLVSG